MNVSKNVIIKNRDNEVVFEFKFSGEYESSGLEEFSEITLSIGDETYSTVDHPDYLFTNGPRELRLKIGVITTLEVGQYKPTITGFNASYDDGYILTSPDYNPLGNIEMI